MSPVAVKLKNMLYEDSDTIIRNNKYFKSVLFFTAFLFIEKKTMFSLTTFINKFDFYSKMCSL